MFYSAKVTQNRTFLNYVKQRTGNGQFHKTVFVDLYGGGKSLIEYFESVPEFNRKFPHIFLLTSYFSSETPPRFASSVAKSNQYHVISDGIHATNIEILNYALEGSIVNMRKPKEVVRLPLEYDPTYVQVYHQAMKRFLKQS